jgi:outer membrane protein assembly factor BamB
MPLAPSTNDLRKGDALSSVCRAWQWTAWIAAGFSIVLGLAMLVGHLGVRAEDPLKSPQLVDLRTKLRSSPTDEQVKQRIRTLDLELRQRYFRQLSRMRSGVYLLIGGVAVFIFAATQVARYRRQPPMPQSKPDAAEQLMRGRTWSRWSVVVGGAAVAGLFSILSLGLITPLPQSAAEVEALTSAATQNGTSAVAPDAASPEELRQNWPRFQGADGNGACLVTNAPTSWDPGTGSNILWKIAVPTPTNGFGSPIVWDDRVFFSSGDKAQRKVFCLDIKNGQTLWEQAVANLPGSPSPVPELREDAGAGYAASTIATDGRRIYAFFGNGDLAAFSLDGKPVWSKAFGELKNPYGHSSSLATWHGRLILQLDQGSEQDGKSALYALDGSTGKVIWQQSRGVGTSWASPIVVEAAGKSQILTLAVPWAISYAAEDGAELWRADASGDEVTPSPVFAANLVIAVHPGRNITAFRPDGKGDVTTSKVVWKAEDNVPDVTTPASNGELIFTVNSFGKVTCFDPKDGKKVWEHEYETDFHASPTIAGNCVYLFSQKGTAFVVEAGREFKELFRTEMGDVFHASPAVSRHGIVLRGERFLWCLGQKAGK